MTRERDQAFRELLLASLDEAFDRKSWHGTTLHGAIRGLSAKMASWRPAPGRHNIWEVVVHAAYWKYAVRRRLLGGTRGRFALGGSNWFVRPAPGSSVPVEATWRADLDLLRQEHRELRAVVAGLISPGCLTGAERAARLFLIRGITAHDLYHAGQIQLLKRLAADRSVRTRPRRLS